MLPAQLRALPHKKTGPRPVYTFLSTPHLRLVFFFHPHGVGNKWLVVVSKQHAKRAVDRNHTKRVLREVIRRLHQRFPAGQYRVQALTYVNKSTRADIENEFVRLSNQVQSKIK